MYFYYINFHLKMNNRSAQKTNKNATFKSIQ